MKKIMIPFIVTVLLLSLSIEAAKIIDPHNIILNAGENYTFSLEEYSSVNIRTYRGNTITANIGQTSSTIMLTNINQEGQASVHVKQETGIEKDISLTPGTEPTKIEIKDNIPVFFIEETIYHTNDIKENQYVVLKLTVPLISKRYIPSKNNFSTPPATGEEKANLPKKDPYLKYFIAVIIVLLILIIILGPKEKKAPEIKSPENEIKEDETPKKTKVKKPTESEKF